MSISSEINRIAQNVSDSLTAVATKGATVPSGANSDDLPDLIASLPSTHSVTYNLTGGASASVTPSKVIAGQGFSVKLNAPTGYNLNNVTVTMGGVDITSQVFTPDEDGGGGGGTPAISVVDTTDSHGGTVREITALDISDTTAVASDVAQGKYFYTAQGVKIAGTGSGGSSGQSETGTFTGDNGLTVQIPCSFEPDLIRVYGDLTGDLANRGIASLVIIKNDLICVFGDTSTSSDVVNPTYSVPYDMVGYNDASLPHASYANDVLTIDMVTNTSSYRFTSGIEYTYVLSTLP